jgi:hypothetical protein
MRSSALRRSKWDTRRKDTTYLGLSIQKALGDVGETHDWSSEGSRPLSAQRHSPIRGSAGAADNSEAEDVGASAPKLELVTFAGRPAPPAREFVVEQLIPRHHPTTLYGWGGTAKSLLAVLLGLSVAGGREEFLGRAIAVHGPVLYLDFELDADEQHRRVVQLATGADMEIPPGFKYVSALGVRTHDAVEFALDACEAHGMVMVVLDSLGPAMVGDMAAAKDVIEFHNSYIAPFKAAGITPILVDHQARQQAGEGYQSKGAFGSAYKEHLSRSLLQVEAGDRSAEEGALSVRLRHKKTNFGALADPFDVALSFSAEKIIARTRELTPADLAQEQTLNAVARVRAALEDGPAYPDEIAEVTGLSGGTVKNSITTLKKTGEVEITGETNGRMEQVRLSASSARPIKDSAGAADKSPKPATVAEFFAVPPFWLSQQLEVYHQDPERHFEPLCTAVAAVILEDGLRWEEVARDVERELSRRMQEMS